MGDESKTFRIILITALVTTALLFGFYAVFLQPNDAESSYWGNTETRPSSERIVD